VGVVGLLVGAAVVLSSNGLDDGEPVGVDVVGAAVGLRAFGAFVGLLDGGLLVGASGAAAAGSLVGDNVG
jgi:hypothetical protein